MLKDANLRHVDQDAPVKSRFESLFAIELEKAGGLHRVSSKSRAFTFGSCEDL